MIEQAGKWMIVLGLALAAAGGMLYLLGRLGVGRLPGDLSFGGTNWRVCVPLGTCVLLSAMLTLIAWFLFRFKR